MKKTIFKLSKVALATMFTVAFTTIANAQGGPTNGTDSALLDSAATVPLDPNMTILFIASAILFISYKYKKGQLSMLAK